MPVNRQACDRCRSRKSRCTWPDERLVCGRCRLKGIECIAPPRSADTASTIYPRRANGGDATSPAELPSEVYDRIQRLEQIVSNLQGHTVVPDAPLVIAESVDPLGTRPDLVVPPHPSPPHDKVTTLDASEIPLGRDVSLDDSDVVALSTHHAPLKAWPWPTCSQAAASQPPDRVSYHCRDTVNDDSQKSSVAKRCYLPPADKGVALLNEYLHDFNSKVPLFNPECLYFQAKDCYSGAAQGEPLVWLHVYIALGIAHRMRAMGLLADVEDTPSADWYLDRCLGSLPELLMGEPSLQITQALLGVSVLLQTSDRWRKTGIFVSTAMKMVQDLGYHDLGALLSRSDSVADRAKAYVFWIAFYMSSDLSLGARRPHAQRWADISTPLPTASAEDWWALDPVIPAQHGWKSNVFSLHTSLALIQAEALEELFSVTARHRAPETILRAHEGLLCKLDAWRRNNVMLQIDAGDLARSVYRADLVHCLVLEGSYFRTVYSLHAACALNTLSRPLSVPSGEVLEAMIELGFPSCVDDAIRLLSLAAVTPHRAACTAWAIVDAVIAALCAVLVHIHSATADSTMEILDSGTIRRMRLCKDCLEGLQSANDHTNDGALGDSLVVCWRLHEAAKIDWWLLTSDESTTIA